VKIMDKEENIREELLSVFRNTKVTSPIEKRLIVITERNVLPEILEFLKKRDFVQLCAISCVDWIEEKKFELIYHLSSFKSGIHVMVKTKIDRENPVMMSMIPVFKNAQTYEREIWEMFGVQFDGNPRLIPLFLDRWEEIPPFRKDFDIREYVKRTFDVIPSLEEKQNG